MVVSAVRLLPFDRARFPFHSVLPLTLIMLPLPTHTDLFILFSTLA